MYNFEKYLNIQNLTTSLIAEAYTICIFMYVHKYAGVRPGKNWVRKRTLHKNSDFKANPSQKLVTSKRTFHKI